MRLIDADTLYSALREAGMMFALHLVETAPTIAPPPATPLTLAELQEMDGEPVWSSYYQCWGLISVHTSGKWKGMPFLVFLEDGCWHEKNIEQRRLTLYRRKPEEA